MAEPPAPANMAAARSYKITLDGIFASVHSFTGADGSNPYAGVIQAGDGNYYGTTLAGGVNDAGTVFKLTSAGAVTTLYSFCTQLPDCPDGAGPSGGLIQALDASFYGTTSTGGAGGYGTIFKLTSDGSLTTLHSLNWLNGAYPYAGLVQATDGSFHGTTENGGGGDGTIFKIT
jgi:uncharacterized repeat protein (TIGR03803 family)